MFMVDWLQQNNNRVILLEAQNSERRKVVCVFSVVSETQSKP